MTRLSMLAICNLSSPGAVEGFKAIRNDPYQLYAFGSWHPARSRREHARGLNNPLHFRDYENAATLRELTRGEGR